MNIEKKKRGRPARSDSREVEARKNSPPAVRSSGSPYLDRVRQRIVEVYNPQYVQERIGDMMEANDEKEGRSGMIIKTPNWRARGEGLKTLLQVTGIEKAEENQKVNQAPTNIVINVMPNPNIYKDQLKTEAVEVKEIKSDEVT